MARVRRACLFLVLGAVLVSYKTLAPFSSGVHLRLKNASRSGPVHSTRRPEAGQQPAANAAQAKKPRPEAPRPQQRGKHERKQRQSQDVALCSETCAGSPWRHRRAAPRQQQRRRMGGGGEPGTLFGEKPGDAPQGWEPIIYSCYAACAPSCSAWASRTSRRRRSTRGPKRRRRSV